MNVKTLLLEIKDFAEMNGHLETRQMPKNESQYKNLRIVDPFTLILLDFPIETTIFSDLKEYRFFGQFQNVKKVEQLRFIDNQQNFAIQIEFTCQLSACLAFLVF